MIAADGNKMKATHTVSIPLAPQLSTPASSGFVLNGLTTGSLISISKLCDDDCVALFSKYDVKIIKDGRVIIVGPREKSSGLWTIPFAPKLQDDVQLPPVIPKPITKPILSKATSAIRCAQTQTDLAGFLHAAAFSPVPSTFLRAIKRGHFVTWPGLTTELVRKKLPKSMYTTFGHLRGQQQNIQSTKDFLKTSSSQHFPRPCSLPRSRESSNQQHVRQINGHEMF